MICAGKRAYGVFRVCSAPWLAQPGALSRAPRTALQRLQHAVFAVAVAGAARRVAEGVENRAYSAFSMRYSQSPWPVQPNALSMRSKPSDS